MNDVQQPAPDGKVLRSRVERRAARRVVPTTDPAALATFALSLQPLMKEVRTLADDATIAPGQRVHSRVYLRKGIFKALRELEARLQAVEATPALVE